MICERNDFHILDARLKVLLNTLVLFCVIPIILVLIYHHHLNEKLVFKAYIGEHFIKLFSRADVSHFSYTELSSIEFLVYVFLLLFIPAIVFWITKILLLYKEYSHRSWGEEALKALLLEYN